MSEQTSGRLAAREAAVDSGAFRSVIGNLASGVTVITTRTSSGDFGMTASSVTSLSLDPPMMLVCLNAAAPTSAAVAEARAFGINVLGHDAADLAHRFAHPSADKFSEVPVREGSTGVPMLSDALAAIECEVVEQIRGGTHFVFLGRVVHADARPGAPLTYFRGGFGRFEPGSDDDVYLDIRARLFAQHWPMGTRLDVSEVGVEVGCGAASALRALTRLAQDGMVDRAPDGRFVVRGVDVDRAEEVFFAREVIEVGVIESVVLRGDRPDVGVVRERFEAMARYLVSGRFVDFEAYLDANHEFHSSIVGLAGSPALVAAFGTLGSHAAMARSYGVTAQSSHSFLDIQRAIVESIETGDAAAATIAIRAYGELARGRARELLIRPDAERG